MGVTELKPWSQSIPPESGMVLLDLAEPGLTVEEWEARCKEALPQGKGHRRADVVRIARAHFLDVEADQIVLSEYLRLFKSGSPRLRKELFFARWAVRNGWCRLAARELLRPHLAAAAAPLAPAGAGDIPFPLWKDCVRRELGPEAGEPSVERTASELTKIFCGLGSLTRTGVGGRMTHPRRAQPDPLAFGWLVRRQLEIEHRTEALDEWVVGQSDAALLFATEEATSLLLLESAIAAGLLVRGYLAGAGRIRLPERPVPVAAGGE